MNGAKAPLEPTLQEEQAHKVAKDEKGQLRPKGKKESIGRTRWAYKKDHREVKVVGPTLSNKGYLSKFKNKIENIYLLIYLDAFQVLKTRMSSRCIWRTLYSKKFILIVFYLTKEDRETLRILTTDSKSAN